MHIVIDGRIISSSTGRYVERLLTYLQEIDHTNRYTVLVPTKDLSFWKPTQGNFSVAAADYSNYSFNEQFGLKRLIESLNPDLVHFCMPQQPILYRGPVITTIHDLTLLKTWNSDKNWLIYHAKQWVGRGVFHTAIRKSAQIITDSHYSKNDIETYDKSAVGKTTVTYLAADKADRSLKKYRLTFKKYILYVGAFSDYKNIRALGDAHQQLLSRHPDLGLVLVGKKSALALKTESYFKNKRYRNIIFTDFINDEERDWLYQHCEAYIFPSLMEGFGLPGLEAMLYGAPVVSSNTTCLPEILGDAAEYFDPYNVNDMANSIDRVLSDETLRKEMTKRGYDQVKKYSWRRMAEQTHAIYMKALNES